MERLVAVSARHALSAERKSRAATPRGARTRSAWCTRAVIALASLGSAAPALACPRCAAGVAARGEVLQQGFTFNLLSALAPFLLVCAVCLWFERRERP